MREIKFRAWDRDAKNMILASTVRMKIICSEHIDSIDKQANSLRYDLMQYTGLKDKNGVEIYEGDIVKLIHKEGHIPYSAVYLSEFKDGCFMFREHYKCVNNWIGTITDTPKEVIGNLYENKELLEQ